jgi:predicted flap endonuclease-1-like 5' DNA nuclease
MLLTALEIIAFMVAAAVIGVALGWVLRGALGNEQVEINDLRSQNRQLKKANRESKAAMVANSASVEAAMSASAKTPAVEAEGTKSEGSKTKAKKPAAKEKTSTKAAKKPSARKTVEQREADQAVGRQAFAEVVIRVGAPDSDDNLTKIYGVGKKYAGMLNDLGIASYAQIAQLRKADVRTLATALGVLDDRLETEDWVGSAKTLQKETNA